MPEETPDGMNIIQYLYYYNGGGVASGDLNNDGLPDLYFTANLTQNQLYLNRGQFRFENITQASGAGGSTGAWKTGVCLADVNADGWLDIYVCQVGYYKKFKGKNQLFINQLREKGGIPVFKEMAAEYGLDFVGFSTQAAFFDEDSDGDLDCFLLNHSVHSPESYKDSSISRQFDPLSSDRLFRCTHGRQPIFQDATAASGLRDGKSGYGLGLAVGDANADGRSDLYVANDFHENDFLYIRTENQGFIPSQTQALGHSSNFSMGCDMADFNNDAALDIITLDMKPEDETILKASAPADAYSVYQFKHSYGYHWQFARNCLQLNLLPKHQAQQPAQNIPQYIEIGQFSGVDATDWSWSALFADLDQDGWKDLFITNGIPHRPNDLDYTKFRSDANVQRNASDLELVAKMPDGAAANYAFQNQKNLRFAQISSAWGLDAKAYSNGAAYADLDLDGDLDLVLNQLNAPASIYQNTSNKNNWLRLRLHGDSLNTFAIGAKLLLYAQSGIQYFENQPVRGFQSCVEPGVLHLALGENPLADSIQITWPDGAVHTLRAINAGQELNLQYAPAPAPQKKAEPHMFSWTLLQSLPGQSPQMGEDMLQYKMLPWSQSALGCKFEADEAGHFYQPFARLEATRGGTFSYRANAPSDFSAYFSPSTSCWRSTSFQGEKWHFIGTRFASGAYGYSPKSLIIKEKNGRHETLAQIEGSVSDARWADVNGDARPDLVLAGEWCPLRIWLNQPEGFQPLDIGGSSGLWQCVTTADMDADGDVDIVAGNFGQNTHLRASEKEPLGLLSGDFDRNGDPDPILTYYRQGKNYVFADKDLLVSQLPMLKKPYVEYKKYAQQTFEGVFPKNSIEGANYLHAETTASCWFENKGNFGWLAHALPDLAQMSSVHAILAQDFDRNGSPDLLLAGNMYAVQPAIGRLDASFAWLLLNDGKGNFQVTTPRKSGIYIEGQVRDLLISPKHPNEVLAVMADGAVRVWGWW